MRIILDKIQYLSFKIIIASGGVVCTALSNARCFLILILLIESIPKEQYTLLNFYKSPEKVNNIKILKIKLKETAMVPNFHYYKNAKAFSYCKI